MDWNSDDRPSSTDPIFGQLAGWIEKHFTINELAVALHMSVERTRQLVKDEPGVLRFTPGGNSGKLGKSSKFGKRSMYRIPESVVQRILRRSANPAA